MEGKFDYKCFASSEGNVWKYVFDFGDAVAEAVLYKYGCFAQRTVLCVSVQSGCPVGCVFCGTGANFIRNLTVDEITAQIEFVFLDKKIMPGAVDKLQIMFMSMGEPFLNYSVMRKTLKHLSRVCPNADLLVSTIAPDCKKELQDFINLSKDISKIGLQFSIHHAYDQHRNALIPFPKKLDLHSIREYGLQWWKETGRKPYINYCVTEENSNRAAYERMRLLFPPNVFCFTFSVVCSSDETMRDAGHRDMSRIQWFQSMFTEAAYDTRVFDPAGQDDIGGGCGQLWYVQKFLKKGAN